eukprot:SAG31_NODE_204_length_20414_cov_19.143392_12_plen_124_part_00
MRSCKSHRNGARATTVGSITRLGPTEVFLRKVPNRERGGVVVLTVVDTEVNPHRRASANSPSVNVGIVYNDDVAGPSAYVNTRTRQMQTVPAAVPPHRIHEWLGQLRLMWMRVTTVKQQRGPS